MMQLTPPEIWKWHAVLLLSIHAVSFKTNILECLGVNLKTVQRIQKQLDKSNGFYECTAVCKPHFDCSYEKTLIFVDVFYAMIDKNPRALTRS